MIFRVERNRIVISTQSVLDEAFVEDTLGLKEEGDCILLRREGRPTRLVTKPMTDLDEPIKAPKTKCRGLMSVDQIKFVDELGCDVFSCCEMVGKTNNFGKGKTVLFGCPYYCRCHDPRRREDSDTLTKTEDTTALPE